jgi:predicted dehydrogenase
MLEKESPDAIIVAVSWNQTEEIIEDVIKSGIPCLIEKPVALSSKKLIEIISATEKLNQEVLVGYNRRFYDFIPQLKSVIESEELLSIALNFPEAVDSIIKAYSTDVVDHILIYMSSHWLDLLMYLIGDVRIDYMHRGNTADNISRAYNGMLYSLKYNVPIHLQANFNTPSQISMIFNFKDAIYRLCPIEVLTVYRGMDCIDVSNNNKIRRYMPKVQKIYEVSTSYKPGFYLQMENFIETCAKHSRENEVGCTLNDALKVTQLCEQIKGGFSI